ncbi:MAG: 2-C-methyl-D-erythritol 4-phosphate cytidylyltransferase [Muribaculaceae bacterium]|nr:2-C-methyl-D-erythritol 4-phosphate cytidylyltransferase [Muribaculaceae bacterium]
MAANKYVIIVAGGSGMRFGAEMPKQFLELHGKPILMRTIEAFFNYDNNISIILVLPKSHVEYWQNLCLQHSFSIPYDIAFSGATRFDSVKNGLSKVNNQDCLIAIHDGVRPMIDNELIDDGYNCAGKNGTAIPVIPIVDSVRERVTDKITKSLWRDNLMRVQTPQVFSYDIITKAYNLDYKDSFTDDASVVESLGINITTYKGEEKNIKITYPIDLVIADYYLRNE